MSYQNVDEPTTPALPGRGKLAWRVLWVTVAFYVVAVPLAEGISSGFRRDELQAIVELETIAFGIVVFLLNYFCLFGLIYLYVPFDEDDAFRNWRVWMAWLFITGFIIWYLVRGWDLLVLVVAGPIFLSPIAMSIGAVIGELLPRLYHRLFSNQHHRPIG
jgi:hypothetical protein